MSLRRIINEEIRRVLREGNNNQQQQVQQGHTVAELYKAIQSGNMQYAYSILPQVQASSFKERYQLQSLGQQVTNWYRNNGAGYAQTPNQMPVNNMPQQQVPQQQVPQQQMPQQQQLQPMQPLQQQPMQNNVPVYQTRY